METGLREAKLAHDKSAPSPGGGAEETTSGMLLDLRAHVADASMGMGRGSLLLLGHLLCNCDQVIHISSMVINSWFILLLYGNLGRSVRR